MLRAMRCVLSADGKHLAFFDGFGLTRLSAPGKVKTERKISGGLDPSLSTNPARTELLAWRQDWSTMHHLALPTLKPLTKFDRFRLAAAVLAPAGGFAVVGSRYEVERGYVPSLERWSDPANKLGAIDLDDAPRREPVTLEGASGPASARLASSPAGVWAVLQGDESTLVVGDLAGPLGTVRWRVPVALPRGAFTTLHPFDDGRVALAAFMPSRRESVIVRFAADGRVEGTHTLATLSPAVPLSLDWAAHQLSETTLARTPLDGGLCRTTGIARDDHGVGRLFGEGGSAWFLPWHAESILDLNRAESVSRRLSDDDASLRRFFRETVARLNALANPGGMLIELCRLDVNPARRNYTFIWDATPGDGSLLGALAGGMVQALTDDDALRNVDGWRWSVGGGFGVACDPARNDVAEVDRAFGALESAGVPLLETLSCVGDAYAFRDGGEIARWPFAPGAARHFLAGLVWSITHRGADGLRAGARALSDELTGARVAAALRALPQERGSRVGNHAFDTVCTVAIDALRAEAAPVIAAATHVPNAWQYGAGSTLEPALQWLASEVSDRGALLEALRRDADPSSHVASCVTRALG